MIQGWKKSTLGESCLIEKGTASAAKEPEGIYPLVTTGAERKSAATWQFDGPAVCIPMISAYGHGKPGLKYVHYQEGKFALANILSALLVRNSKELSAKFLATFLNFYKDHLIVPLQFGAANMSITIERLATVPIWYPLLSEQERILHLLDEAESLRKLRSQATARMEEFVAALFQEMFGDLSTNLKKWDVNSIKNISKSIDYGVTASSTLEPIGPKFLRITDIQNNTVDWETVPYCKISEKERQANLLKDGDIVFARTGATTGKSYLIQNCPENTVFASYLIRVRPSEMINPTFLFGYFKTKDYWLQISKSAVGAAQPGVNATKLGELKILIPPISIQHEFAQRVQEAGEIQSMQVQSAEKMEALYQSMLSRAFAGEL